MAIYIEIKKIETKNNIHYYQVFTQDFIIKNPFYIGISPSKKLLYVYINLNYTNPELTISTNNPTYEELLCDFIPPELTVRVLARVREAIRNNDFPEYISHCA